MAIWSSIISRSKAAGTAMKRNAAVGDDDRVPVRRRGAREEPRPLLLHEVGLVGDQDAGGRVELQEFARGLRQAVAGHHQHRLADQAEPLLLHDRGGDGEGLSGADGVGDVGRAGGDDAPDHPLLVVVEPDDAAGAGQGQMAVRRNGAAPDC